MKQQLVCFVVEVKLQSPAFKRQGCSSACAWSTKRNASTGQWGTTCHEAVVPSIRVRSWTPNDSARGDRNCCLVIGMVIFFFFLFFFLARCLFKINGKSQLFVTFMAICVTARLTRVIACVTQFLTTLCL